MSDTKIPDVKVKKGLKAYFYKPKTTKKYLILLTVFILCVCAVIFVIIGGDNKKVNKENNQTALTEKCKVIISESKEALDKGELNQAKDKLSNSLGECGQVGDSGQPDAGARRAQTIKYQGYYAEAAYRTGDKVSAIKYADQILETNKSITQEQRDLDPGILRALITAQEVKQGNFEPL